MFKLELAWVALCFAASLVVSSQTLGREDGTSFEKLRPGAFQSIETAVGVWDQPVGKVAVDHEHAKTVGILYEGSQSDMVFQRIPLADILDAAPAQAATLAVIKHVVDVVGQAGRGQVVRGNFSDEQ